jgi:predicted O-methyltransferase YrrM
MLIHNLKTPHRIPIKLLNKIIFLYKNSTYDKRIFENKQNVIFQKLGLNREDGSKKLKSIKKNYPFLLREMSSEHEVLFSSLSQNLGIKINKILEIGTFDGANSFLLSKIFVNAQIETIDLPHSDKNFKNFYNRKEVVNNFIKNRNNVLSKNKNIHFIEKNSINLINQEEKYDLIWVDGAHGYPTVCIDIINCLKLIKDDGHIMVDDIFPSKIKSDEMYDSVAGYETLEELRKAEIINFKLIYKRLDSKNNCEPKNRKFVALVKKKG